MERPDRPAGPVGHVSQTGTVSAPVIPPYRVVASGRAERVLHVHTVPARTGERNPWPAWVDPTVAEAFERCGVSLPWRHQALAADAAWQGRHVAVATGTASGKSLIYQSVALSSARIPRGVRGGSTLYVAPTKALAADQVAALDRLAVPGVRAATYDGDTPADQRRWIRDHAQIVLTNPDLVHHSLLPGHPRWASFLRRLQFVVLDEAHHYRGLFGSHVAVIVRRLRRVARHYGADPVFLTFSATAADPEGTAADLTGIDQELFHVVSDDHSPRGRTTFLLWEPPLVSGGGENGAPTRRSVTSEAAELLTDLVASGIPTLAFVASRRGVETVASTTRRLLAEVDPRLPHQVAAYRGGYLPEERRALEADLRAGRLLGLAATNALELGIDVSGLDAVLICGWPGRRASLWQQAGRAGRDGQEALAVLVARDDPLDTYLVHHPEAIFGRSVEATVLDPGNPYVLAPHLCAAAAELPLVPAEVDGFGPHTVPVLQTLVDRGLLRRRARGWYWPRTDPATPLADLRGAGGEAVRIVDPTTGRVLGTVDAAASHHTVHTGAVYLHQGEPWRVIELDLDTRLALVEPTDGRIVTHARERTDVRLLAEQRHRRWGAVRLSTGTVEVTSQVVSFLRRSALDHRVLGEEPLDLPPRQLRTTAVWWTVPAEVLATAGVEAERIPGAAHAAEHAAIGMLPLVATCDRWDIGGVSTALHPHTGLPTIVVHDGHPGGAGFAERGFAAARTWLGATATVVRDCECESGCPSCVQSPKCGNGNDPLDKGGAARLLDAVLADADQDR
ncbi:MAG: DEAD/DEAH box helicase [Kineosporiaceae bacterium]|nr:DEAD/DEAH box helicase [Kineosporiaceae bacterium]